MKKISIDSWAYTIGPYTDNPVLWEEVIRKVAELGFDGIELGGFPPHPNPDNMPDKQQRESCRKQLADLGLSFSGGGPSEIWYKDIVLKQL